MSLDDLWLSNLALSRRFPAGQQPFQMVARLAEECGELAAEVNHWEATGVKREKHGEPDPATTAKEVMDVLRAALQIASHYGLESELEACIQAGVARARDEGRLTDDDVRGRARA